ncbi:glycosyl hydrolase catalytic core-domain-containing protein [Cytidiella melzeri]|nr:glycosyl hydrolase catalytic core-domain-containing protein [Cytidiella melzeri]
MAALKFLNLLAVLSVALFASTLNLPVNALAHPQGHSHLNRNIAHDGIARRKRANGKRCKPKSSSSSLAASSTLSSSAAAVTTTPAPKTTTTIHKAITPVTTAPATPPSSGGGKLLIGWNGGNAASLALMAGGKASVVYDWSVWSPENTYGLNFAPMLWGSGSKVSEFEAQVTGSGNGKFILGFNEPDYSGQSNLSPSDAAGLWKSTIQPKKSQGYELIGPAPTGSTDGVTWMANFIAACDGCDIDALAIHVYETDPQVAINFVTNYHNQFGKPVWITEIACQNFGGGAQCTEDNIWTFWTTIMEWASATSWVEKIAPFSMLEDMGNVNPLNQGLKGGQLTDLGNYFVWGSW